MSRNCSVCGKDGIGMTTKAGGLTRSCAPRQDAKKWSTSVPTRCTREPREVCIRETEKAPVKTRMARDWQGTASQAVTSRGTEHLLHESAACHKIDQISSLHQCRYVVRWQKTSVRDMERVVPLAAEWRAGSVCGR